MRVTLDRRETPLDVLERAVSSGASGELVTATDAAEVHVYILAGRVAWGTSSSTRSAFTQHLIEHCGLDRESLREAIGESQRTRTRLGETLVSWGLVSRDDLRAALRVQVNGTLEELASMDECQALFLPRHMEYDGSLTFSLEEVWPDRGRVSRTHRSPSTVSASDLARLFPDAKWSTVLFEDQVNSSTTTHEMAHQLVRTLGRLVQEQALRSVVLRSAFGSVLGAKDVARHCSLWVALPSEAKLGVAITMLNATSSNQPPLNAGFGTTVDVKVHGRFIADVPLAPMRQAMAGADQMLAAFVTNQADEESGLVRAGFDPRPISELTREGRSILTESYAGLFQPGLSASDLTYENLAMYVDLGRFLLLQTRLVQKPGLTLSLAFEGGTTPGLAWALLGTLSRQLND